MIPSHSTESLEFGSLESDPHEPGITADNLHTRHRSMAGTLHSEELMGEEGFSADSSLLYHRGIPSAIVDAIA